MEPDIEPAQGVSGLLAKLRQLLSHATDDREAEARALADRAGPEVDECDALVAVERAHGERRDVANSEDNLATVEDARAAAAEPAKDC